MLTPQLKPHETRSDFSATWSPDGATVAFVRKSGKHEALYLVDADGSNIRRLVTLARLASLAEKGIRDIRAGAWSADGSKLLFTVESPGVCVTDGLFAVGAGGSDLRRLWRRPPSESADVFDYAWSPDGTRALFTVVRNLGDCLDHSIVSSDLDVVSDLGSTSHQVVATGGGYTFASPNWSPDGDAIAYATDCEDVCNLALAYPQSGKTRRLTHFTPKSEGYGLTHYLPFAWSGRGKEIILGYPVGSYDSRSLYSISAGTGKARRLVTAPCPGPRASCFLSQIYLYAVSSDGSVAVFDVRRNIGGAPSGALRYAAYLDQHQLVRLPLPSLRVDGVYMP